MSLDSCHLILTLLSEWPVTGPSVRHLYAEELTDDILLSMASVEHECVPYMAISAGELSRAQWRFLNDEQILGMEKELLPTFHFTITERL